MQRKQPSPSPGAQITIIETSVTPPQNGNDLVRLVCDRHFGAGADGVALISQLASSAGGDFGVRIFNPDGSEA
ncbi:MAG: hypothetical protein WKF84_26735 [Pyrinomonadaceae bacterium]